MATVVNEIDATLQAAPVRGVALTTSRVIINASAPLFKVNGTTPDPATMNFEAVLIDAPGTVEWSASKGTIVGSGLSASLAYSTLGTNTSTVITATVKDGANVLATTSITITVVKDGTNGTSPNKVATAYLYQWAPASPAPAKPASTSTFTWASGVNTAYAGSDGWTINVPTNPGTPGLQLYVAAIGISAASNATTTTVSYASGTMTAWAQNGGNGSPGLNTGEAVAYRWAATIPSSPVGTGQITWATGALGTVPTDWTFIPSDAPSPGMTLWAARVYVKDTAEVASTSFQWTNASVIAVGYSGTNGTGTEGASYVTAYCASTTATTTTAPANTTGRTSVPVVNGGGITGTWVKPVPALTSGQFLYQSDGIYNPATNTVVWSIPYWSSLKVASLSAIAANLGVITGGEIHIGGTDATSWHVDLNGNQWAGAGTFPDAPFRVSNTGAARLSSVDIVTPSGVTVLSSNGTFAEQAMINPNILPSAPDWFGVGAPAGWCWNEATGTAWSGQGAKDGYYHILPKLGGTAQATMRYSRWFHLEPDTAYTLSFWAASDANNTSVIVDLVPDTLNETRFTITTANVKQRFVINWVTPNIADARNCHMRFFENNLPGQVSIWDVKLERGIKATAWCDTVVTPFNAATQIADLAVGTLQIGNNAVTVPQVSQAYNRHDFPINAWSTILEMNVDFGVNPPNLVLIHASANWSRILWPGRVTNTVLWMRVVQDDIEGSPAGHCFVDGGGQELASSVCIDARPCGPGVHNYKLQVYKRYDEFSIDGRTMVIMGAKK